jgi:hypothetical protein
MKSILIVAMMTLVACGKRGNFQLRYWDDTTLDKEERVIVGLHSKGDCLAAVEKLTIEFNARPRIGGQKKTGIRGTCEQLRT